MNIDAVFISDLHLHPEDPVILQRFKQFVEWASVHVGAVYILGDFFHVWAGDDLLDDWSRDIAAMLARLHASGVSLFYLHGNRDFLLGKKFAKLACLRILKDPTVIHLNGEPIVLTHGDRYCKQDRTHQWFMRFTRNTFFIQVFLRFPKVLRKKLVDKVRHYSQENTRKPMTNMAIDPSFLCMHLKKMHAHVVIHGHIHQPGLTSHEKEGISYRQYVLSDWDDKPNLLCYNNASGFSFMTLRGE